MPGNLALRPIAARGRSRAYDILARAGANRQALAEFLGMPQVTGFAFNGVGQKSAPIVDTPPYTTVTIFTEYKFFHSGEELQVTFPFIQSGIFSSNEIQYWQLPWNARSKSQRLNVGDLFEVEVTMISPFGSLDPSTDAAWWTMELIYEDNSKRAVQSNSAFTDLDGSTTRVVTRYRFRIPPPPPWPVPETLFDAAALM